MGEPRYGYYGDSGWIDTTADDEKTERVEIDIEEYHGLLVARDMVQRRALQQIDKATADEHGYMLLRADQKAHKEYKKRLWLITKTTPYSIKISPEDAKALIEKDLRDYYGYCFPVRLEYEGRKYSAEKQTYIQGIYNIKVNAKDIFAHWSDFHTEHLIKNHEYSLKEASSYKEDQWFVAGFEWLKKVNYRFTFDICKLSCNYAQGKYEVSYWGYKII